MVYHIVRKFSFHHAINGISNVLLRCYQDCSSSEDHDRHFVMKSEARVVNFARIELEELCKFAKYIVHRHLDVNEEVEFSITKRAERKSF